MLQVFEAQSEKRPGTSISISSGRSFHIPPDSLKAENLEDDLRWFSSSNTSRREGGYVHSRSIWDWVPSGRCFPDYSLGPSSVPIYRIGQMHRWERKSVDECKLERESIDGSHPFCVVVGIGKLSVDFLNGVHGLTGVPELAVHCVETNKVIPLDTVSTETTDCFAFCHC
jgi:hypothetical protein